MHEIEQPGKIPYGMELDMSLLVTHAARHGWFHKQVNQTSESIEIRWCADQEHSNENVLTDLERGDMGVRLALNSIHNIYSQYTCIKFAINHSKCNTALIIYHE